MSLIGPSFSAKNYRVSLRSPFGFLILVSIAMPIAMSGWLALLNNFVVEKANFTGSAIGWLHTVREIPGFLTFTIVFVLLFVREQRLIIFSLITLGLSVTLVGHFPFFSFHFRSVPFISFHFPFIFLSFSFDLFSFPLIFL